MNLKEFLILETFISQLEAMQDLKILLAPSWDRGELQVSLPDPDVNGRPLCEGGPRPSPVLVP